ncbi:MAG: ligand-binding sensor domain-containing protein/two-component sensor histidine kinase [Bacteroidia bacterium]|jgi:ligand-binding sensor domain-containing protein/two-component sensor histidine kinase
MLKRTISCVFLILASTLSGMAQQNYFRHFGLEDGLPQSQVFDVLSDSRGFIWVGTRGGGIARFDGNNFESYNTKDGLINNFVNCLLEDSEGDIWIGTQSGLSQYNGIEFKSYPISKDGDIVVLSLFEQDSTLYIGTSNGLYIQQSNKIIKIENQDKEENFYVTSITTFGQHIYMGTNRGLYLLNKKDHTTIRYISKVDGLPDKYIQCLLADSAGVWVGTYGKGIRFYDGDEITNLTLPLPYSTICYDLMKRDNKLWIATQDNGVFLVDLTDRKIDRYSINTGLTNNHVRSLTHDGWGNVWLGTSGGGLNQFAGQQFNHLTIKDGLPDNYTYAISQDRRGAIWAGTGRKGVVKMDSGQYINYAHDSGFADIKVKAIGSSLDGTVWFGTEGDGLAYYQDSSFHWLTVKNGLCGNYIKDIVCVRKSTVWVSSLDGGISELTRVKGGYRIQNYRYLTELPSNRIHALHADKQGTIWFGTESKGVGMISRKKVQMVLSESQLNYQNIRAIRSNKNGLWIATSDGLYRYDLDSKTLTKPIEDGLRSSNLYLLEFDKLNHLYLGHERGLEKLTLNETGDVIEVEYFGSADGFSGIETCQNASLCDREGNMWFGTINGLTQYNPNNIQTNETKPRIWLDNIDLFYEKLSPNTHGYQPISWNNLVSSPKFPYDQNHLTFSFVGVDLNNPTKLRYQWKLEGFDPEWRKPTQKKDAVYSNLPSGQYALMVKSISSEGIDSEIKEWPFEVLLPFWKTWWFRLCSWLIPALLVGLFLWIYVQRIKARGKREREKLEVEKELIELEQKALRLQMNPHFLFNALNSIQSLVALEQHQEARKYLQKFAKLMRLTLQNSRVDTIPLSDEITTLRNYVELEQFSMKAPFEFNISILDDFDADEVYIPPMMLQPFVENAIKHGLPEMKTAGKLEVKFQLENHQLVCRIIDNGIGREAALEKAKGKSKSHESAAIQVITDRLNMLNKEHEGNSLEIQDLEQGTAVVIRLAVG